MVAELLREISFYRSALVVETLTIAGMAGVICALALQVRP